MKNKGFMLIEVIAAVAVVGVCLTLIVQALLTNLKAGTRFQQRARAVFAMENQLGIVFASNGMADTLAARQDLKSPYDQLSFIASSEEVDEHLTRARLSIGGSKGQSGLNVSTLIFHPEQAKSSSLAR